MNGRAVLSSFKQQFFHFIADPQWIIPSIIAPFIFTAVMLMMYPEKSDTLVLQAMLGGGVLGMWGNTLFSSSFSLSYDRMNGTLDNILSTPTELYDVMIGRSLWNSFIGSINMVMVCIFAELVFLTPIKVAEPVVFALAMVLVLISLASIGLLFSVAFVFSRRSYVLTSILEYPIYVLSGAIVPITMLPEWCQPISLALAPAWGVEVLRESAVSGYEAVFGYGLAGNMMVCAGITVVCILVGWIAMRVVVRNVRETGSFTRY